MAGNELHGAEGIRSLCALLGGSWKCRGTESAQGFFLELVKANTSLPKHCSSFLLSDELKLSFAGRGAAYAAALLFCFLGLVLITEVYMKALDTIVKQTGSLSGERIWNPAIADITLLALGTCAPQVSLAVVDTLQHLDNMSDTGLGAGTLLGSAAFNLFPILAVCVVSPIDLRIKSIRDVGVYVVELIWSFWAYAWLLIILQIWTPNVVTIWEAALTILQFPILVLHAYVQDKRWKYVSIPWKYSERPSDTENTEELSVISENTSKHGLSTGRTREPSFDASGTSARLPEHSSELFELDTGDDALDSFLSRQASEKRAHTWKDIRLGWKQQFANAMSVDSGTGRAPSVVRLMLHPFTSYWKIGFAFIPPVELLHGWPSFLSSIGFITGISYTVVKLSNSFDCVTGLNPYVFALTILAAGTSFPNLVASKIAAKEYETADSAIANINASNCINVFIGFGIPWCISALYHTVRRHETFEFRSPGLGVLLAAYFTTAVMAILVLALRRNFLGGELGGPKRWAYLSAGFFGLLWIVFLVIACSLHT